MNNSRSRRSSALLVFAKEPLPGTVKTRLNGCCSGEQILGLYKAFVRDTLAIARELTDVQKYVAFSGAEEPRFLTSVAADFELFAQSGRNLGARMHSAFVRAQERGAKKTVIIGTDAPTLPARLIRRAFACLSGSELVLGPADDGGFYLIGLQKPRARLFRGVRWSSGQVLRRTLANAATAGMSYAVLEPWYDIDDADGLRRLHQELRADPRAAPHTRGVLNI